METKEQTNRDYRELTTTEIPLAVAEIVDRMSRLKKAHVEWWQITEADMSDDPTPNDWTTPTPGMTDAWSTPGMTDAWSVKVRDKYDIPHTVPILEEFGDPDRHNLTFFKTLANKWVRGKFTAAEMEDLYFIWECLYEFDFCWVFMGKSAFYYQHDRGEEGDANILEWLQLGCRNNGGFKPSKKRGDSGYSSEILRHFGFGLAKKESAA